MTSDKVFEQEVGLDMAAPEIAQFTLAGGMPDFGYESDVSVAPLVVRKNEEAARKELLRLSNAALAAIDDDARDELGTDYLSSPEAMRDKEGSNYLMGADFAKLMTGGDVYAAAEHLIADLPEEERESARGRLNACGRESDGCRLVGELWRNKVRGQYAEQQRKLHAADVILQKKMSGFVAGDELGGGENAAEDSMNEAELAQLSGVMDKKALDDARAVREWMRTYVRPLDGAKDAEYVLRNLDSLEDELYELIGEDESRAGMAYQALMHWAEKVQKSGKVGVSDEFVVAVGRKLSNWGRAHLALPAVALAPVGSADAGVSLTGEQQESFGEARAEYERKGNSRAMLRAAIDKSLELGDDVGFWKGAGRSAAQMAGDSLLYFLPGGAGMVAGSLDTVLRGATEGYDEMRLRGLSGNEAAGQSVIDTGVQTAVELTPWGRIGGRGLSGFLRKVSGKAASSKPGVFTRWLVKHTQQSTLRAVAAEGAANVVDEAILEPIAGGLMTYGAERTFDVLGVPHGQSRNWAESFEELAQIWGDPTQLAGLVMFSAGISGATAPRIRENVKWFARTRTMWEAQGLPAEQVDDVMASEDPLAEGSRLVNEGWKSDPAGMRKRIVENNRAIKERGEVLVLTGQGAMDAALANEELAPVYAGVWRAYAERGVLPYVEAEADGKVHITKKGRFGKGNDVDLVLSPEDADAYLMHEFEEVEKAWLLERQRAEGAEAERPNLRGFMMHNVSEVAGGAMLREAAEKKAVRVEDVTRYLPEELSALVKKQGGINRMLAERISDWARGMIDGLMADGASEVEARSSRDYAEGAVMSLGDMESFARSFAERGEIGQLGEGAQTSLFRRRGGIEKVIDGMKVLGSTLFGVPGRATAFHAVEDVAESMLDEVVQARVWVLTDGEQMSVAEATGQAWKEMAGQVARAREAVLKADSSLMVPVPDAAKPMSVIEAFSAMAMSKFILSSAAPGWMKPMVEAMKANLTAAAAVDAMGRAWAAAAESDPDALGALADVLDKVGVRVADALSETRLAQADVAAWTVASGIVMSHVNGPDGAGGMPVSKVVADAEDEEQAIMEREAPPAEETVEEVKQESARAAGQAERLMEMQGAQGANAPAELQGVFDGDNCAYNATGGYWFGMIQKSKLVKSTEQVKVGTKGKHGVIAGRELTGNFQASAAPLYVWMRTNGELWLISGRHRYELMMRDNGVDSHPCYVFREDAEHDEKWARMMDYENNMRDDQADEVTAATYVRETGLSDEELTVRGLMRNASRSKRGALIGRHAREELWTRFSNGKVNAKDAEIICNLTRYIKDQGRIDEIQRRCCMLLDNGKSWDFIGGMVQLMVQAEAEQGQQGWFNFGADFEAALERAATWIEKALKAVNENIALAKSGRDMSGKKAEKAARLGISTNAGEDVQRTLQDLQVLKGKLELIGSYPELRQQAEMWDGESDVDPVGWMLQQQALENERMAAEKEMEAEEYLKAQQAEATGELFSMSISVEDFRERQLGVLEGEQPSRVVDFKGVPVDIAVDGVSSLGSVQLMQAIVLNAQTDEYAKARSAWENEVLPVLEKMVEGRKKVRPEDVRAHIKAGKHSMAVVKDAIGQGKIPTPPERKNYPSLKQATDEEALRLHKLRDKYFVRRRLDVLDILEQMVGPVKEVDFSKKSSSTYYYTSIGKVRLSDHYHAGAHMVDLRFSDSDEEVRAKVDAIVQKIASARKARELDETEENLPGGLPLLDGYVQNELGHGEIANLLKLADFLEGEPIAAVADNSVNMPKSLSEITDVAAEVGQQLGTGYVDVPDVGKVGVNVRGIKDSMNHFMKNRRTSDAHKQRACDALLLVKDVLQKGKLVDYGLEESKKLVSYLITAPVIVGANQCVMVVRVRKAAGQDGNFYLHGIDLLEQVKEKSRKERQNRGAGLDTGKPDGADPRDVFRVIRKSFSVKYKQQNKFSFSMERNLAAVHSLSPEKFLAALELGGMPMPSVAVTRLDRPYGWGGAGNIMLVGRPALVDPKEGTEVYSRDAWTGNFPRVEHKVIGKKDRSESVTDLFQLRKKYQNEGDYNSAIHQLDYRINMDYGGEQTGRSDMDYALRQRTGKALFAWQSGYQPRPKMKDAERVHEWLTKEVASRLRRYVALTPDEYHEKWPDIKEEVRQEIEKVYRESSVIKKAPTPEAAEKRLSSWVNVALRAFDAYSPSALAKELDDVKKIDARVLDIEANLDMLAKYADKHKKAYEAWIEQKLNTWFSKESYIHGTKREATLDNLTEYMLGDKARGKEKGLAFGSGLVRAYQAERMNTLADIKDRRELLTDSESSNEMKSLTHGFMEDWREGGAEILNRGMSGNGFTVRDDLMETLAKVKGEPTAEKVRAATRKMFRGATNLQQLLNNTEVINAGVEALKSLHAELEDYMEAVPQRAVRMNEWEYAVMPESLKKNKAVMAGLRENGIRPRFHDGTEEGRKAALAGLVNDSKVSFSVVERAQEPFNDTLEFPGEALVSFSLQSVMADWSAVLDRFVVMPPVAGTGPYRKDLQVCPTPAVMQMVGAKGWDIVMSPSVLVKCLHKDTMLGNKKKLMEYYKGQKHEHDILLADMKQLPIALADPVCIVISDTPGCLEVVTELKEGDRNILAAVQLNSSLPGRNNAVKVNRVVSLYGKDKIEAILTHPRLYWNAAKARIWIKNGGLHSSTVVYQKRASGHKVLKPEDLVKYKMEKNLTYSMSRVTQRSLELLEARSDEEVAQQIMKDLQSACERLATLLASDTVDARRGDGLKVYAEMQALISAVRSALPEKYLHQGNLEMLLRWASVYAKMATDGEVPVRGTIKGDVFDSFVAVLERQNKQEQLHGMTAEESREALMELAGEKLEVAFMKVARDCMQRIDQFLNDRALERIEWLYKHAYPTREEGKAWGRGKMDAENYRVVKAAWQLVQNSLNKRKEAEEEMRQVRRQMAEVRELMKEQQMEEGEGKRKLKKLREQLEHLELAAMQTAAEQQAQMIKSISEELESLDSDATDFSEKEAAANERMALQQTFGNWYYKDAQEARRAARVFEDMVLRGKKKWEEKLKLEREEIAYWREQILSGFEVSREKATNRRMMQRNAVRTQLDKQLVGMGKGLMNFGHLMMALRPLLGKRFCDMKREQIARMHTNTMAFNTELKGWMFRTLRDITGLETEAEQELWLAEQNQAKDTGIVITERAMVKAVLTYAEAKAWLGMSKAERAKERERLMAAAALEKRKPSNVPTEEMMEELAETVKAYEADRHGVDPQQKKFVVQAVEEWQTELHTTKDAILFGILTFEQPDYERLMEPNGITPEILDQMRRYVGPKMLRWGYAMREKLSEHGVNVARVFEEYTGIPFDAREKYFKGVFDQGALKEQTLEQAVAAASGASGTGSKYGSLIPRRYHMSKINWDTSAAGVFVTSMQQQNNYVQTSKMVRGWRALLTDKAFAARFEAEIGTAAKQQIIGWLELIEGAVVADVKMAELSNRMMRRLMGGYAKASLGGNIRTLIKQVSALLNGYAGGYVPDQWMLNNELCQEMTYRKIGFGEYMMALARVLGSKGSISKEEAGKQSFIYARKAVEGDGLLRVTHLAANQKLPGQTGPEGWLGLSEVPQGAIAWLGQKAEKVVEKAMDAIAVVDAEMCTASAMAIADVAYRQAVAADTQNVVPDEVKRAEALRLAGMALDVAGQPQLRTQKSYWAASGALGGMGDFLFMFRSDTLSKAGLWIAQMSSGERKTAVGGFLAFGVMNSLVLAMLEGLRGNLGDEDDEWYQLAGAFALNVLTNDATALPVVGDMLAKVRARIMGEPVFQNGLSDLVPFGEVFEYGKREVKNLQKDASWDRHWNATAGLLRAIGSSCAVCQDSTIGPLANLSSLTMAAAVFANATKFVQGLIKLGEEVSE